MNQLFEQANRLYRTKEFHQALTLYEKLIDKDGSFLYYYDNMYMTLTRLYKESEADIRFKEKFPEYLSLFLKKKILDKGFENFGLSKIDGSNKIYKKINDSEFQKIDRSIQVFKKKLLNLGFYEKALAELKQQFEAKNPIRRIIAARELSLYFLNKSTLESAEEANKYIDYCLNNELDEKNYKKAVIMKAECLRIRGRQNQLEKLYSQVCEKISEYPDLTLSKANSIDNLDDKLKEINKIFEQNGLSKINIELKDSDLYSGLKTECCKPILRGHAAFNPLITVIMPTYNAEETITVALESLQQQTWRNIEVLVVDDCSTDNTAKIVNEFSKSDPRIKLLSCETNSGPYVARNIALLHAKGDFITTNDADDWSHAQKLEIQLLHLISNPQYIGNTSQQARATPDLVFHRRGNYGYYNFMNMSSFMFRKEILKEVGFWDSVRFGADSEFIRRIKMVYGPVAIADLDTPPLSFQRQSSDSLTGNSAFGYHGFFMGARKEHFESYLHYHSNNNSVYYEFPQKERPFQIPEPMRPKRSKKSDAGLREFDVVIVSDFRLDGGSTLSSVEEIKAHLKDGLTTALVQMYRYDYQHNKKINPKVRELLEDGKVEFAVYGEKISCKHLIFRYPPILQHKQQYIPEITALKASVIVNQPPMSDYGKNAELRYEIPIVDQYATQIAGVKPVWRPIGPAVRETLFQHHLKDLKEINLANDDWFNIIDIDEWYRGKHKPNQRNPIIGRHSRDNHHKWPKTKEQILQIYPDNENIRVHILGGGKTPLSLIGYIPENWIVHDFGSLHPKEFLKDIDVYVYYTNDEWVESFGRVVLEAMAVGIPVILPKIYEPLFKGAALYSEPENVLDLIFEIIKNADTYRKYCDKARVFAVENFSYKSHCNRLFE